jgi:hypothetical protein
MRAGLCRLAAWGSGCMQGSGILESLYLWADTPKPSVQCTLLYCAVFIHLLIGSLSFDAHAVEAKVLPQLPCLFICYLV